MSIQTKKVGPEKGFWLQDIFPDLIEIRLKKSGFEIDSKRPNSRWVLDEFVLLLIGCTINFTLTLGKNLYEQYFLFVKTTWTGPKYVVFGTDLPNGIVNDWSTEFNEFRPIRVRDISPKVFRVKNILFQYSNLSTKTSTRVKQKNVLDRSASNFAQWWELCFSNLSTQGSLVSIPFSLINSSLNKNSINRNFFTWLWKIPQHF